MNIRSLNNHVPVSAPGRASHLGEHTRIPLMRIRITNPLPGGNAATSLNRARRFVRQGRAQWSDTRCTAITFIHRLAPARHHIPVSHDSDCGYDRTVTGAIARDHELRGVPVTDPGRLLGRGRAR